MTTTPAKAKEESLLPPKVMTALTMVASGTSFDDAAECVGMSGRALRKWRKHRDANEFIELANKAYKAKFNINLSSIIVAISNGVEATKTI